jgi:hypothetical protein
MAKTSAYDLLLMRMVTFEYFRDGKAFLLLCHFGGSNANHDAAWGMPARFRIVSRYYFG